MDPNIPFVGCAPHRFVQVPGAPKDARPVRLLHLQLDDKSLPFAPKPGDVAQCTCEMAITGVDECDLLYVTPGEHVVFKLHMTQDKRLEWEEVLLPVAKKFLFQQVVPKLARHVLQRDYTVVNAKRLLFPKNGKFGKRLINRGSPKAKCKDMVHISEFVSEKEFMNNRCTWLATWNNRPEWTKKAGSDLSGSCRIGDVSVLPSATGMVAHGGVRGRGLKHTGAKAPFRGESVFAAKRV